MAELEMCRICLAEDVRMHSVTATHLQQLYEALTMIPFEAEDGKPRKACYICYARLENCYKLRTTCLKSEEMLGQMLRINMISSVKLEPGGSDVLGVTPVKHYNLGEVFDNPYQTLEIKKEETDYEEDTQEIPENTTNDTEHIALYPEVPVLIDSIKVELEEEEARSKVPTKVQLASQRNFEDITTNIVTKRSQATDGTEDPKTVTVIAVVGNLVAKSKYVEQSHDKQDNDVNKLSESNKKSSQKNIPTKKSNIKPSVGAVVSNSSPENSLEGHKTYTGKKIYECSVCKEYFDRKYKYNAHMHTHPNERQYQCKECKKYFSKKKYLTKHTRTHTREKPYQCQICYKTFNRKDNMDLHVRIHTRTKRSYPCSVCGQSFERRNDLLKHTHIVHTPDKPYECSVCEKCFKSRDALDKHYRLHTGEKPYQCDICKKCFTQKGNLSTHIRAHTGEDKYQCNVCKKDFNRKFYLKHHMRIHTGEKPFECDICNRSFTLKINLNEHLRSHMSEKKFKCKVCKKSFHRNNYLSKHMLTHTGEKPYQCKVCNKRFSIKGNLNKHVRTHAD